MSMPRVQPTQRRRPPVVWLLLLVAVPLLISGLLAMHVIVMPTDGAHHASNSAIAQVIDAPHAQPNPEVSTTCADCGTSGHEGMVMMTCVLVLMLVVLLRARSVRALVWRRHPVPTLLVAFYATQKLPRTRTLTELSILRT